MFYSRRAAILFSMCVVFSAPLSNLFSVGLARQQPVVPAEVQSGASVAPLYTLDITVTDEKGNLVKGIKRDEFTLFDGKRQAEILAFDDRDAPASIGILLDTSNSIHSTNKVSTIKLLKTALARFLAGGNPANEYFLIAFNQKPQLLLESSNLASTTEGLEKLSLSELKGMTALYDALYLAVHKLGSGIHRKRAIFLITDGQDSVSNFSFGEVKRALAESNVIVYVIGLIRRDSFLNLTGQNVIIELTDISGGRAFYPQTEQELNVSILRIVTELRNQYTVGFIPVPSEKKDDWHEIKIKVTEFADPKGKKIRLLARTRKGFYGANSPRR